MTNGNAILTEIAPGELIDKITILEIKMERITDESRLKNVKVELDTLMQTWNDHAPEDVELREKLQGLWLDLKRVNEVIWDQGERLRVFREHNDTGSAWAKDAMEIHEENDKRAALKKEINLLMNSRIIEEKSYKDWK